MEHKDQYRKEKRICEFSTVGNILHYTDDYVKWLENKLDIEHRRRVAAEKVIANEDIRLDDDEDYNNWQSIKQEAGE
jgi:hypothetical protein